MLVLTRRIGEALWVGDAALTLRDRRGDLVLVSLLVPPDAVIEIDGTPAEPAGALRQLRWHLHWLLCGECLRVGEARVRLGVAETSKGARRGGQRQLRIAVDAPPAVRIRRVGRDCPPYAKEVAGAAGRAARQEAA